MFRQEQESAYRALYQVSVHGVSDEVHVTLLAASLESRVSVAVFPALPQRADSLPRSRAAGAPRLRQAPPLQV